MYLWSGGGTGFTVPGGWDTVPGGGWGSVPGGTGGGGGGTDDDDSIYKPTVKLSGGDDMPIVGGLQFIADSGEVMKVNLSEVFS